MNLNIKVHPNSGKQEIVRVGENNYEVYLKSAPEGNKANIEMIKLLSKYFNSKLRILRGRTSRKKVVEVENGN